MVNKPLIRPAISGEVRLGGWEGWLEMNWSFQVERKQTTRKGATNPWVILQVTVLKGWKKMVSPAC